MPPFLRSSKPRPLVSPFLPACIEKPQPKRKYNKTGKIQKKELVLKDGLLDLAPNAPLVLEVTAQNAKSHLLSLPAELRNKIWKYVLDEAYHFDYYSCYLDGKQMRMKARGARRNWLGLLRSCRQIYNETALLPYQLSSFHASNHTRNAETNFIRIELLPGQAAAVAHLRFSYFPENSNCIALPMLSRLKTFTMSCRMTFKRCNDHAVREPAMRRWIQDAPFIPNEAEIYIKFRCDECYHREGRART